MEKLRMFYAADLHGDLESLKIVKEYLDKSKFDITVISGDYIHLPLNEEELESYMEPNNKGRTIMQGFIEKKDSFLKKIIQEYQTNRVRIEREISTDMIKEIQHDRIADDDLDAIWYNQEILLASGIRSAALDYKESRKETNEKMKKLKDDMQPHEEKYIKIAEANMHAMYQEIKKILSGTNFLALPGNHDGKCLEDIMKGESLHKQVKEVNGLKIAGYGGAPVVMPIVNSIFTEYLERQVEEDGQDKIYSEPMIFLLEKSPDIAVTHEVPMGAITNAGNQGLGIYVAKKKPILVLSGHMHEFNGVYPFMTNEESLLVMPGKLGKTEEDTARYSKQRTFAEIGINKGKKGLSVEKVAIKKITDKDEIKTLSEHNT